MEYIVPAIVVVVIAAAAAISINRAKNMSDGERLKLEERHKQRVYSIVKCDNSKNYAPDELVSRVMSFGERVTPSELDMLRAEVTLKRQKNKENGTVALFIIGVLMGVFSVAALIFASLQQAEEWEPNILLIGIVPFAFIVIGAVFIGNIIGKKMMAKKKLPMLQSGDYTVYTLGVTQKMWRRTGGRHPRYYYYVKCGDIVLLIDEKEYNDVKDKVTVFVFRFPKGEAIEIICG